MDANRYLYLDRGPQSIINRFQLYDASNHLLEDIQNFHLLYGLVKVCTGNKAVMEKHNIFFKGRHETDGYNKIEAGDVECKFIYDPYNRMLANNAGTSIPLTLTFVSTVFGNG